MVVQVPDDEFGIVRAASDGFVPCDESPFRPLPVGIEVPAAFEFDAVEVGGEAFEFFHQRFADSAATSCRCHAKVGDGCIAASHAIEEIAEDLILFVRGDKQRALGDAFLKGPAWHEAESPCIFAVECKHVIAPILVREVVDGEWHVRRILGDLQDFFNEWFHSHSMQRTSTLTEYRYKALHQHPQLLTPDIPIRLRRVEVAFSAGEGFEFGGGGESPGKADEDSAGDYGYLKFSPRAFQ